MVKNLKLFNYYQPIHRNDFVDVFTSIFNNTEYIELLGMCERTTQLESYLLYYNEGDYYIIDLVNGYIINWYKHLGRCLVITIEDLTLGQLTDILTDVYCEFMVERKSKV